MKTEELKALGLTDDQIAAVMKHNGQDVENAKGKYADYEDLKHQLSEAGKIIEELKGKAGDTEAIQKMADDWKQKAEKAEKDGKARLDALRFEHALERALGKAGAKNAKAVRALLDPEKLKLDVEKDEINGLKEQLEKVKEENDFLFRDSKPLPKFSTGTVGKVEPESLAVTRAIMGIPEESK